MSGPHLVMAKDNPIKRLKPKLMRERVVCKFSIQMRRVETIVIVDFESTKLENLWWLPLF